MTNFSHHLHQHQIRSRLMLIRCGWWPLSAPLGFVCHGAIGETCLIEHDNGIRPTIRPHRDVVWVGAGLCTTWEESSTPTRLSRFDPTSKNDLPHMVAPRAVAVSFTQSAVCSPSPTRLDRTNEPFCWPLRSPRIALALARKRPVRFPAPARLKGVAFFAIRPRP
ncbi:hypothetical protein IWZ00DRAFT_288381 [Phyllosticta capitalensis]